MVEVKSSDEGDRIKEPDTTRKDGGIPQESAQVGEDLKGSKATEPSSKDAKVEVGVSTEPKKGAPPMPQGHESDSMKVAQPIDKDKVQTADKDKVQAAGKDKVQAAGKDKVQAAGKDKVQAAGKDKVQAAGKGNGRDSDAAGIPRFMLSAVPGGFSLLLGMSMLGSKSPDVTVAFGADFYTESYRAIADVAVLSKTGFGFLLLAFGAWLICRGIAEWKYPK